MRLVLHLMKKDLYRLRWDIALYAVLVLISAVVLAFRFRPPQNAWGWFLGLQALLLVVIGAQLIHVDGLVGTTAFWRTRPISRATLLAAKTCFALGALMMFPAIVTVAVGRLNGLWWRDALIAAGSALVAQGILVFPVLAVASVTPTLAAFVLVGVVATAGAGALHSLAADWVQPSILSHTWSGSLESSRSLVYWISFPMGGMIVLTTQTLTLKTRRAVAVGVIAQMLFVFSSAAWTWDFVSRREPAVDPAVLDPGLVTLRFHPDKVVAGPAMTPRGMRESERQVAVGLTWAGVPVGLTIVPAEIHATFRDAKGANWRYDQSPVWMSRRFPSQRSDHSDERERAMAVALGGIHWLNGDVWQQRGVMVHVLQVPSDQFKELEGQRGTLTLQLDFEAAKFAIAGSAPLASGARFSAAGRSVVIERASLAGPDDARALLVETHDTELMAPGSRFAGWTVVRNLRRREALSMGTRGAQYMDLHSFEPIPYYLHIDRRTLTSGVSQFTSVDRAWIEQAELVRLEPVPLGRFTVSLRIDDFVMKATTH